MHKPVRENDDAGILGIGTASGWISALAVAALAGATVMLAAISSIAVVHRRSADAFRSEFADNLRRLAQAAASQVDGDLHDTIVSPDQQDSQEFAAVVSPLRHMLQRIQGVKYIYTAVKRGDHVYFIVDSAMPGDHDGDGRDDQAKILEEYVDAESALLECFAQQMATASAAPYQDDWGVFITGYAPFFNRHGELSGVVGVDVTADEYEARLAVMSRAAWLATIPALLIALSTFIGVCTTLRIRLAARRYREQTQAALQQHARQLVIARDQALNARQQAETANRSKSEFLANMSHEIRTPMTAILGYTELLLDEQLREPPSPETRARREHLLTVQSNGEHLLAIINDILDISKVEAGRLEVDWQRVSPLEILQEVMALMRVRLKDKPVSLVDIWEGEYPETILTDPLRLRQILVNLLGNAIKFTDAGQVAVHVSLDTSRPAAARMVFSVEDTGIGMSSEQVAALFRPFAQVDSSATRRYGGSGLGLLISKRLANLLGGDITVESEPRRGSVFRLEIATGELDGIPCRRSETLAEPAEFADIQDAVPHAGVASGISALAADSGRSAEDRAAVTQSGTTAGPLAGRRILLVEDGPDNQRLIAFLLRKAGAAVTIADNGKVGVEQLTVDGTVSSILIDPPPFDLIVMDMQMPEMDGYQATGWLRQMGCTLPIVALTAHAMQGEREKCLAAGCSGYATKPIRRDVLLAELEAWLPPIPTRAPVAIDLPVLLTAVGRE